MKTALTAAVLALLLSPVPDGLSARYEGQAPAAEHHTFKRIQLSDQFWS